MHRESARGSSSSDSNHFLELRHKELESWIGCFDIAFVEVIDWIDEPKSRTSLIVFIDRGKYVQKLQEI